MLTVESHWVFFSVGFGLGLAIALAWYLLQRASD